MSRSSFNGKSGICMFNFMYFPREVERKKVGVSLSCPNFLNFTSIFLLGVLEEEFINVLQT